MRPDLPLDYDKMTHAFLPKLSAAYDVTKDVRVGLLVQRAYNPGGTTLDPKHRKQLDFKPEYLWDFEAFTRASMLGGRVSLNANLFYNRIRDAQRELDFDLSSPAGKVGLLQILSEPKSRSYGAELELNARPTDRLTMTLGAGLLDTKITKGSIPNDPYLRKQFFGAPPFTAAAGADWQPVQSVHLSVEARHESGFAGDDSNTPLLKTRGFWIVDGRASWTVHRVTLFAYGRNLFDTFETIGYAGPRNDPFLEAELTDPREVGIGIDARF
jgi:outer membrane receptor protein involved in Fe transport